MKGEGQLLPVDEPKQKSNRVETDLLHPKYLVALLPPDQDPDRPYYRGDIYEKGVTTKTAKEWGDET